MMTDKHWMELDNTPIQNEGYMTNDKMLAEMTDYIFTRNPGCSQKEIIAHANKQRATQDTIDAVLEFIIQ